VARTVTHIVGLAAAVPIKEIGGNEIVGGDASRVAYGERRIQHRRFDWSPDIHDGDAMAEQLVGLAGKSMLQARDAGGRGLVDMDAGRGLTGNLTARRAILNAGHAAAERVIEDMNPSRAGYLLQQFDGLRIVNPLQLLLVPEILDRASVAHELETRLIE
jgi:hypothetical protein